MYIRSQEKRLADPFSTIVNIPKGLIKRLLKWTFVLKKARLGYIVKLKKKWWEHKRRPSLSAVLCKTILFFKGFMTENHAICNITYDMLFPKSISHKMGLRPCAYFCESNTFFLCLCISTSIYLNILCKVPQFHMIMTIQIQESWT